MLGELLARHPRIGQNPRFDVLWRLTQKIRKRYHALYHRPAPKLDVPATSQATAGSDDAPVGPPSH